MAFTPHNGIYPSQWHLPPTMAFTRPQWHLRPPQWHLLPTMAFTPINPYRWCRFSSAWVSPER